MAELTNGVVQSPWTHNVIYGLAATGLYSVGSGLFQYTVLPSFILAVSGSKFGVGFAEGLQGVSTMLSALPAGYLADKFSRKVCIRLGSVLQFVSSGVLLAAVVVAEPGSHQAYALLCVSLSLSGICDGIVSGPLLALMDDSCPAGRRSDVETANSVMMAAAQSVGLLLGLVVFLKVGNHWSLDSMRTVIWVGAVLGQIAIFPIWRMDDSRALGEQSEAVHLQERLRADSENSEDGSLARQLSLRAQRSTCCGLITPARVRLVLFVGELIMAMGSGMTVKFLPVFFSEVGHIKPSTLQIVFAAVQLLVVLGTLVAKGLAKRFGRLQIIIPAFVIGISCTMLLGLLEPFYTVEWVMMPIFFIRCSFQWSVGALLGSILADYTPKKQRGRWKALGSVENASWSGSAAVGGILIDHFQYGPTFVITGLFQACVLPLWCLLLPLVAKESELLAASQSSVEAKPPPRLDMPPLI